MIYCTSERAQYISVNAGICFKINAVKRLAKLNLSVDIITDIVSCPILDHDTNDY